MFSLSQEWGIHTFASALQRVHIKSNTDDWTCEYLQYILSPVADIQAVSFTKVPGWMWCVMYGMATKVLHHTPSNYTLSFPWGHQRQEKRYDASTVTVWKLCCTCKSYKVGMTQLPPFPTINNQYHGWEFWKQWEQGIKKVMMCMVRVDHMQHSGLVFTSPSPSTSWGEANGSRNWQLLCSFMSKVNVNKKCQIHFLMTSHPPHFQPAGEKPMGAQELAVIV